MRATTAMLADAARVESGKLFIHGGGWDSINVNTIPATHPTMALVLVLRIEYDQALTDIPFVIDLLDEDDQSLGVRIEGVINAGHPPRIKPGTPTFQPLAMVFNMVSFPHEGGYRFRVTSGDSELASVPFRVRTSL